MRTVSMGSIADDMDRIDPLTAHLSRAWRGEQITTKMRRRPMAQDPDDEVDDLVVTRTPQSPHAFREEPVHELLFTTDDPDLQKMCGHVQDRRVCMLTEPDHAKWTNNASSQTSATIETAPEPVRSPLRSAEKVRELSAQDLGLVPENPPQASARTVTREFILGHALQRIVAMATNADGLGPTAAEIAQEALDDAALLP